MRPFALRQIVTSANALTGGSLLNALNLPCSAAYSLRKLNDNFGGAVCRVRRSSDAAELDIGVNTAGGLDELALMNHVGAENLLLNSDVLVTQNVTVAAVPMTISIFGSGSITLSGTGSGTLAGTGASRAKLTFTPTAGTLTITPSGSVTQAQLNRGNTAYDYCKTAGSPTVSGQNLAIYSEQFDNIAWGKVGSVVAAPTVTANAATAPDGTATADQIAYPQVVGTSAVSVVSLAIGAQKIVSFIDGVWLKGSVGGEKVWLYWTPDGVSFARTPCVLTTSWQQFTLPYTGNAVNGFLRIGVDLRDGSQTTQAAQTIFAWGNQCNEGTTLLPYNVTTGSTVDNGSGYITKIYDQSGNARDLVQATAANQPRIVFAGVIDRIPTTANRPAFRTDGAVQNLASASFVTAQPFTRSSVLRFLKTSGGGVFSDKTGVQAAMTDFNAFANALRMYAGNNFQATGTIAVNDTATLVEQFNSAASLSSYNGAIRTGDAGTGALDGLTVGRELSSYGSALFGDLLIFPNTLAGADRQTLEANQKSYFSTP